MAQKQKRKLKTGFTTGTAAAAAAKGALSLLLEGVAPSEVRIALLTGDRIVIPLHTCRLMGQKRATCSVIKDAGDDPDITHRAEIGATVSISRNTATGPDNSRVSITGGEGVGVVTKPGLEVLPGQAAINPGPRKMITGAVREVLSQHQQDIPVEVEIFVPKGRILAEKTLNARLGILGGLSILGTTGIVKPLSHEAYTATIESAMSVARAEGLDHLVLTTGRRSERFSQNHWRQLAETAFVQIGDFFKMSLDTAARNGFERITLAVFFGKAVKMAQGVPHTHAAKSSLSLKKLSEWSLALTGDAHFAGEVLCANTARHAFDIIDAQYPAVISEVGRLMQLSAQGFTGTGVRVRSVIFDYEGRVAFDSETIEHNRKQKWDQNR